MADLDDTKDDVHDTGRLSFRTRTRHSVSSHRWSLSSVPTSCVKGTAKLVMLSDNGRMSKSAPLYKRHRFPPEIIQYAVWLYYRFSLSQGDIEDLLAQRGIIVRYESIRLWCNKFGPAYSRTLKRRHHGYGDTFYIDEVFVKICGKQHYLWRAVDQDGEIVDVFLQNRRNGAAAKRFFKRLLKAHHKEARKIVTDKLRSYGVAHR